MQEPLWAHIIKRIMKSQIALPKYFEMKKIAFLIIIFSTVFGFSQSDSLQLKVKGKIIELKTKMPIARVTVLNKNTASVVLASENGDFEISAKINDKLLIGFLTVIFFIFMIFLLNINHFCQLDILDRHFQQHFQIFMYMDFLYMRLIILGH